MQEVCKLKSILIVCLLVLASGCCSQPASRVLRVRVLDVETGSAINGANVTSSYVLWPKTTLHGAIVDTATTNDDGIADLVVYIDIPYGIALKVKADDYFPEYVLTPDPAVPDATTQVHLLRFPLPTVVVHSPERYRFFVIGEGISPANEVAGQRSFAIQVKPDSNIAELPQAPLIDRFKTQIIFNVKTEDGSIVEMAPESPDPEQTYVWRLPTAEEGFGCVLYIGTRAEVLRVREEFFRGKFNYSNYHQAVFNSYK